MGHPVPSSGVEAPVRLRKGLVGRPGNRRLARRLGLPDDLLEKGIHGVRYLKSNRRYPRSGLMVARSTGNLGGTIVSGDGQDKGLGYCRCESMNESEMLLHLLESLRVPCTNQRTTRLASR